MDAGEKATWRQKRRDCRAAWQARNASSHQTPEEAKHGFCPGVSEASVVLTPWFRLSGLQNCDWIHFCGFKPLLEGWWFVIAATGELIQHTMGWREWECSGSRKTSTLPWKDTQSWGGTWTWAGDNLPLSPNSPALLFLGARLWS